MTTHPLPKLTCLFLAYNRQECIREALESAFAMEYDGELEYVICDDCSTDATYSIIQDCVSEYRGGRRVIVLQTPQNMNLAGNACYAVRHSTGDWIVRADDDDLNFPYRCRLIADAILRFPHALCFLEPLKVVSDDECRTEKLQNDIPANSSWEAHPYDWRELKTSGRAHPLKQLAVKTYARSLYSLMGDMPQEAFSVDDVTMGLRALSAGTIVDLRGYPSILYRRSASSMSTTIDGDFSVKNIREKEQKLTRIHQRAAKGLRSVKQQFLQRLNELPAGSAEREVLQFLLSHSLSALLEDHEVNASWWEIGMWKRLRYWSQIRNCISKYTYELLRTLPLPLATRGYAILKMLTTCVGRLKG